MKKFDINHINNSFTLKEKTQIFLALFLVIVLTSFILFRLSLTNLEKYFYNHTSEDIISNVSEKFASSDTLLISLVGLSKVDYSMHRNSFYLMTNELMKNNSFIKSVSYFQKVKKNEKEIFENRMNDQFFYNYKIKTQGKYDFYLPLKFIEPNIPLNSKYYGKDILTNKSVYDAILENVKSKETQLIHNNDYFDKETLLFSRPNYYGFEVPKTADERKKQFQGIFVVSFEKNKLIDSLTKEYSNIVISFDDYDINSLKKDKFIVFRDKKEFKKYGITLHIYHGVEFNEIDFSLILISIPTILVVFFLVIYIIYSHKSLIEIQKQNIQQEKLLHQQARLAQMGEMISMIAHQWRQPLSAISGRTISIKMKIQLNKFDLSKEQQRDECKKFVIENLDSVSEYVKSLTSTIDDFRNFFKPNKEKEFISLIQPINQALKIVENSLSSNSIDLELNFLCNDKLLMYQNEMMQVILNILKNSEDNFLEKQIENPKIKISTFKKDNKYHINIEDNGGGIPDEVLPKIFDPYFSTKDEKNGTGIGLYMSKVIVEEHNKGILRVKNIENGVCFQLLFNS